MGRFSKTKASSNSDSSPILIALSNIDRPSVFACSADLPFVMPGLEVEGLGMIGFPLAKTQAQAIIKQSYQAPYGKGIETLVDTKVRRVWELDPKNFKLLNPAWEQSLVDILGNIQTSLGLKNCKLTAQLYKLLIYEKGDFFLPHRDGEKMDGMVATLVVTLPSLHKGGELLVSHEGHTEVFKMEGASTGLQLSYTAFYADCEHEVKPLKSGYRMCLVYNCVLEKQRKSSAKIVAPSHHQNIKDLVVALETWQKDAQPQKIAITLEHQYSEKSLSFELLKGVDRAKAEVIFEAAQRAQCEAYLGLLTLWQSGDADEDYEWDDHYRRSSEGPHEMGEIYDESLSVDHWSDREGQDCALGNIHFSESEVLSDSAIGDWEPDDEEFEGYTGNAGMTLERWYHRAVIAIWPSSRHEATLCDAGTLAALGGFDIVYKKWKAAKKSTAQPLHAKCCAFGEAIISKWEFDKFGRSVSVSLESRFLNQLCELDALSLVQRFFSEVLPKLKETTVEAPVIIYFNQKGWANAETSLGSLFEQTESKTILRNLTFLEQLCNIPEDKKLKNICSSALECCLNALDKINQDPRPSWEVQAINRQACTEKILCSASLLNSDKHLQQFIATTESQPKLYSPVRILVPAIINIKANLMALAKPSRTLKAWLKSCEGSLSKSLGPKPEAPTNWVREKLKCKCRDCAVVNNFLEDGKTPKLLFPLAKARRQHLHETITKDKADLLHETLRQGSPQTLVLTKTNQSYDEKKAHFEHQQKNHLSLQSILQKLK
jgi:hypothetical protein